MRSFKFAKFSYVIECISLSSPPPSHLSALPNLRLFRFTRTFTLRLCFKFRGLVLAGCRLYSQILRVDKLFVSGLFNFTYSLWLSFSALFAYSHWADWIPWGLSTFYCTEFLPRKLAWYFSFPPSALLPSSSPPPTPTRMHWDNLKFSSFALFNWKLKRLQSFYNVKMEWALISLSSSRIQTRWLYHLTEDG